MERGQEDHFAMMHKLLIAVARLENDGLKMQKVRSESLLMNPLSQQHTRSGLASSAATVGRKLQPMVLSERISEMQSYAPWDSTAQLTSSVLASSKPGASATILSNRDYYEGAVNGNAKVLPMAASPRRHLVIPALLRQSPTQATQYAASGGRLDDMSDAASSARAAPDLTANASHSKRSKHHHLPSSHSKPDLFKRGLLTMLRSSPRALGATTLTDQLWATGQLRNPKTLRLRLQCLCDEALNACEDISSIRE